MCKFCGIEPGESTRIKSHRANIVVKGKTCGSEELDVGYYVFNNDKPEHHIVAQYCINDTIDKATIEIPIKFCPFCGRKVHI